MPLRPALGGGGGGGAAAWESAGGYFLADVAEVIQAGDAFKFVSRETDLGGDPAFIFDTEVSITQDLLHIYKNTLLRLTVENDGNLIPGQGSTHGGFDLGKTGSTVGLFCHAADQMTWSAGHLYLKATLGTGTIAFWSDAKQYMTMNEHMLELGHHVDERGWSVLRRRSTAAAQCGLIEFEDEAGVSGFLWKDQLHNPRFHTADPVTDDTVGAGVRLNIFGMLFTSNGVGTQTLTVANSNYKITQMDDAFAAKGGMTLSAANNKITVPVTGLYRISFHVSFTGSLAGIYKLYIVKNAAGLNATRVRTQVLNDGDLVSVAMSCFQEANAGHDLEVWVTTNHANAVFVVKDLNFTVDLMERT